MPIYHFDVRDGIAMPDEDGQDLPGLEDAKRIAVELCASLMLELSDKFWNGEEWSIEVRDHNRLMLFSLVFFSSSAPALIKGHRVRSPQAPTTRASPNGSV